ncbi:MAG TPA: RsmB/NOP family class I SAM-dependent RNA methyltransferase [Acetobacteraceae bacterium]|nr:RsmB/NOP family class I SAM-dependent RNA methyltransferase [Acetobacteraceae bacterium]
MTPAARIAAAIDLLRAVEGALTRPADAVANDYFRTRRFIGAGDRRAVSERAWGVLRARRRLAWWLARAGAPPTPRLLVAAALLCEGWSAQGLGQAFSGGRFAAERLDAEEQAALGELIGRTLDHPSMPVAVRLELPDWILPKLEARFGASLGAELTAMLEPAPLDMRANLLKGTREDARTALAVEGYEAEPTRLSPWGLRLPGRRPVTAGKAFQSGLVEIQDEGSQLVALLSGAKPGMRVLDLCAGAGGKTLALAAMMENRGHIAACDVSTPRLDAAVRRFRRAGVHNVERHKIDVGDRWLKRRVAGFDRVLVDAPCTGTGTWRRNPDARTRLTETDLAELVVRQAALLDDAAPLVRKGGWLVYATCSLLPEENEEQVHAFVARHAEFAVVPLARAWTLDAPAPCGGELLVLTPRQHGTDGFFCVVLERAA